MLRRNRMAVAVSAAVGLSAAAALTPLNAIAQDEGNIVEEVIVTGSAIKRKDLNNALPVQVLDADAITRAGITNAGDLMEKVPAMQNFTKPADSVGGSGGGLRTANLRGLGDQYTLTLMNGRRMAPADSGSSVDLSNIPMAAVERVEVLTDGASALYGSDAIAGVVNFILKDSVEETTISVRGDQPDEDGGESWSFDIVTGFGDLQDDGYSLVATYSHEELDPLAGADRDFAETGLVHFASGGNQLYFENSSANNIPGNAYAYTANYDDYITGFNPYRKTNGDVCPKQTTPSGEFCRFDYTSTLEILPESERDTIYLNGKMKFTENMTGFATVMVSEYETTNRIAPYPSGEVPLPLDSALVQNVVFPHLTPEQQAMTGEVTGTWRALPASNRTTEYLIDSTNFTFGIEGDAGDIGYTLAVTHAKTEIEQNYPTGWLLLDEFVEVTGSGSINIFAGQDEWTADDQAALEPAIYHGNWDTVENTMTSVDGQASMPLFEMGGGEAQIAIGFDWRTTNYDRSISDANAAEALLFLSKDTVYELERDQWGLFAEVLFPVCDAFEVTASLRYDDVSAVEDKVNGGNIDKGDSDSTYKLSALYTVNDAIAFRGSFGTGFKAPSMREIGEPQSDFGVTSGTFACPFAAGDPRTNWCKPGENQVNVYREGSGELKFETSEQYTFGVVLTPWDDFDMTIDYWNVEMEDLVDRATEQQILNNPAQYDSLFTTKTNTATGKEELAIIQAAINVGSSENSGIDWAVNQGLDLGWGQLDLGLRGTYMIESDNSLYGSSLGRFGADDEVVFRNIVNFNAALYHGNFTHTVLTNWRGGYTDQAVTAEITGTGAPLGRGPTTGVQLEIASYSTTDYQLRYMMLDDSLGLNFGVKNLFDKQPHLSLRESGAGHQVGWDPRYNDGYGRTYYLSASYAF
ncbi:MAG: TonB-dependent receptor [Halieaceae bacterium]|nr:TonB-dependent receptor [Halieaceae bacterium]